MKLEGKVCLITGGSSGIGAATALEFAFRGVDIAICGLPADDLLAQDVPSITALSQSPPARLHVSEISLFCPQKGLPDVI